MSNPSNRGWPLADSPFHAGEQALQERFGRRAALEVGARRGIRDHLPEQHREFFAQLPYVLAASVDAAGQPWATILTGRPGFLSSPDPRHLRVGAAVPAGDPFAQGLAAGAPIGLLGIELATRRRNRANGRVEAVDEAGFSLAITQSFGNCPQYIQSRDLLFVDDPAARQPPRVRESDRLGPAERRLLQRTDTFFIATANVQADAGAAGGADASHRGGWPGFVRVDDDATITTPDFVGNFFFNTLGNLMVEPRAGLLFADFDSGDVVIASGRAEIVWDGPEVEAFEGAERLVRFRLSRVVTFAARLPFRGSTPRYARELARTGRW